MSRVIFLVDGFNLYHAIAGNAQLREYLWLDLRRLCQLFTTSKEHIENIFWFTAYYPGDPARKARHQLYARALRANGVIPVWGRFSKKEKHCKLCDGVFYGYEEKLTDVNIAITLFQEAVRNSYDTAIIVSGDSDLLPAIHAVKNSFPDKTIKLVIPPARQAEALKSAVDLAMRMKRKHLRSAQLPSSITLPDSTVITKPERW